MYCHKNSKINKMSNLFDDFLLRKQFFEKIITEGGLKLIVLNPFLDSLCNSAFKNIGLAPGIPNTCFQHPQDILYTLFDLLKSKIQKFNFNFQNNIVFIFFYQTDDVTFKIGPLDFKHCSKPQFWRLLGPCTLVYCKYLKTARENYL